MRRLNEERGFTIVEVMAAVVILLVGALGTLAMMDTAGQRTRTAEDRQKATSVAREVVEVAKSIPYRDVDPATIVTRLRQDASIAGASASPWVIERDGTRFTITAEVCWLDETADGLGSRAGGGFCAGTPAGGDDDGNPVDYKRVTVTARWRNGSGAGSSQQTTLVAARGGGDAPAVSSIRMSSPTSSPITAPTIESASFAVTTATNAASVVWAIDGVPQGTATGSGRNWTFTWPLPALDGTYDISARAHDSSGMGGETRSVTVAVNRFAPFAPTDVNAGRNGSVVEIEWRANRERDVIGYRVYRQRLDGAAETACETTTETSCIDASPPSPGGTLDYWVVAIDRSPTGGQREGAPSARIDVNIHNNAPNPPTAFTLSKDAQGRTVLRWEPPAVADPDQGDFIESYRIYRDGTAIANRYDRVDGTATMTIDEASNGVAHQYWITSVDSRLSESSMLGPVTG